MLTPSQQKALSRTHHLSVTANAGSGKTKVLVERFVDILVAGDASVKEVVALTFTDKAASELRRKIAERVKERLASSANSTERLALETVRDRLSSAVIGTIHWFCSKILREYPVEAGVDASFTVVEGIDQVLLLQESIKETFYGILKDDKNRFRAELYHVLRTLGKAKVVRIINALAAKREVVERLTGEQGIYSHDDAEVLRRWNEEITRCATSELYSDDLIADVQQIMSVATGKDAQDAKRFFDAFEAAGDLREKAVAFDQLMGKMVKSDGGIYKSFLGKDPEEAGVEMQARRLRQRYQLLESLLPYIAQNGERTNEKESLRLTRCLLAVQHEALERYQRKKQESSQLDFEDLQLCVKELLKQAVVTQRLAQRFKFIMVDEYQDTNKLQYEILLPLLKELSSGNLFIVGDPKQSIYAFRFADVGVFNQTKNDILEHSGPAADVVLDDSFRPLKSLAAFVNLVFAPIMCHAQTPLASLSKRYEVGYEPIVVARPNDAPGRIEIILRDILDAEIEEGELIARRILQVYRSKEKVFDKNEQARDVRFGDIAILLRTRTPLVSLESALIRYRIPYVVTAGIGYYQTQDIYDFYNYFQFLLNPDNDVALAGILRSPFFLISDAELYESVQERRAGSFWKHLCNRISASSLPESVDLAVRVLRDDLEVGLRLPIQELISRIAEQTSYLGKMAGSTRSEQSIANLDKLRRLAQRYDALGLTNLYDFTRRLKRLIEEEETEGQGTVDVQSDAVQIMTIHAAKGLEFPVVIMPNLEKPFRFDEEPYVDDSFGIAFDTPNEEEGSSAVTALLRRQDRIKTRSEEKRIFYVGCTRARDILILSGARKKGSQTDTYMDWLLDALGGGPVFGEEHMDFSVPLPILRQRNGEYTQSFEQYVLPVHIVRPPDLPPTEAFKQEQQISPTQPKSFIAPILSRPQGEIFSASKIRTYLGCPSRYFLRYVLGLRDQGSPAYSRADEDEESERTISGELLGTIVHSVMEKIDSAGDSEDRIRSEVERVVLSLGVRNKSNMTGEITRVVRGVTGSDFWMEVLKGQNTKTEYTITATLGDDYLTGTIDRVYQDQNGVWNVLDFKTDAIKGVVPEGLMYEYSSQLKFYALLVHKFFSTSSVRASLLFTSSVDKPISEIYASPELELFEQEVSTIISKIKNGDFHSDQSPCAGCPFLPKGCPAHFSFSKL